MAWHGWRSVAQIVVSLAVAAIVMAAAARCWTVISSDAATPQPIAQATTTAVTMTTVPGVLLTRTVSPSPTPTLILQPPSVTPSATPSVTQTAMPSVTPTTEAVSTRASMPTPQSPAAPVQVPRSRP